MDEVPPMMSNDAVIYSRTDQAPKPKKSLCFKITIIGILGAIGVLAITILVKVYLSEDEEENDNCSEGFFKPNDADSKITCYPCDVKNCKKCNGSKISSTCTECKEGSTPEINENNEIINCIEEKDLNFTCGDSCLECKNIEHICTKCATGYFIPDNSITEFLCEKCSLENCDKCEGERNNDKCITCKNNYLPEYEEGADSEIKFCDEKCYTGDGNKCLECDFINNECLNCNSGYYLPSDRDKKFECNQCSLEHCQNCQGTKDSNKCYKCENNYEAEYEGDDKFFIRSCKLIQPETCDIGPGDKCLTCSKNEDNKCASCNPSYKLVDGNCELDIVSEKATEGEGGEGSEKATEGEGGEGSEEGGSEGEESGGGEGSSSTNNDYILLEAKYISTGKKIRIIGNGKNIYINSLKVDDKNEALIYVENDGSYYFNDNGIEHKIEFKLKINKDILNNLFNQCEQLISIEFKDIKNGNNVVMDTMEYMFFKCSKLTSFDISKLSTSNINNINQMFSGCSSLKIIDFSEIAFTNVKTAVNLFANCISLTSINLGKPFNELYDFNHGFTNCSSLKSLDLSKMKPVNLKYINYLFSRCYSLESINLNDFKTDNVINMAALFHYTTKLKSIDLSQFKTNNVQDMKWMFFDSYTIKNIDFSSFDTSQVTDMKEMFYNCTSLTSINFGNHFSTVKVTDMSFMFGNCFSILSLNLGQFNTAKVKNMYYMFNACKSLTSLDVSSFDTSQVTSFLNIFTDCYSLTSIDFHNFNFTLSDKSYTGPPLIHNCKSLKYIDMRPVSFIFRDFFTGIPNSNKGTVRASRTCVNNLLYMGIRVLLDWDWIVG